MKKVSLLSFVHRDDAPVTGPIVFSRDVFEKFTLAPTIKEIYALLQRWVSVVGLVISIFFICLK